MKKEAFNKSKAYFEKILGNDLNKEPIIYLTGFEVIEFLWPLNDIFRPHLEKIKTIKYQPSCGLGANKAIEDFAKKPHPNTWSKLTPCVWRVLLERHQQFLVVAAANQASNNFQFSPLPKNLPEFAIMPGLMLLWLHSMELPWPPEDRSQIELPEAFHLGSMKLQ